jgi:DNA-binding HxlR family transcriptional regulator
MAAVKKRSVCPVACTLDLIGDKWTLLVIRDLFAGKRHFGEFARSPEKIATNILADRLEKLVQVKLAQREPAVEGGSREAYVLTERGRSLLPVLKVMRDWGLANVPGTAALIQPRA